MKIIQHRFVLTLHFHGKVVMNANERHVKQESVILFEEKPQFFCLLFSKAARQTFQVVFFRVRIIATDRLGLLRIGGPTERYFVFDEGTGTFLGELRDWILIGYSVD